MDYVTLQAEVMIVGYGEEHEGGCWHSGGGHGYGYGGRGYGHGKGYHECPACGMKHHGGYGKMGGGLGSMKIVRKATKKLLIEKVKARIETRYGDKLDAVADELVDIADEKLKMKKEIWKRKKEMKQRMMEILSEDEEEAGGGE